VLGDRIREPLLAEFVASHAGYRLRGDNPRALEPDFVSGASISAGAMRGALLDSAEIVLSFRGGRPRVTEPTLDLERFRPASFAELLAQGAVARRTVSIGELRALFAAAFGPDASPDDEGAADALFVDLYTALATPPAIGRNLLGRRPYEAMMAALPAGGQALIVASTGRYPAIGGDAFRPPDDAMLERLRVAQDGRSYRFGAAAFQRIGTNGTEGIRALSAAGLLTIGDDSFDPLQPWQLVLVVPGVAAGEPVALDLALDFRLPAEFILLPGPPQTPAWLGAWQRQTAELGVLGAALTVLTLILSLQARLARHRRLHRWVRNGFLLFTLVWLGWIAGAQLSILNVINYLQAPFRQLGLGFYLAEPLIVVLAGYTALSLLLLGRGVFCGWLCPFGALQELSAQAGRLLKVPQWTPGETARRRLRLGKYASAAALIAISAVSLDAAVTAAEIEPFKTAITLHFERAWPFVVYAAGLLALGLVTERAYCRFLCPLGGALAFLGRLHLLNLLRRRPECGSPCRLCERACPVGAIGHSGRIDTNECFQCLDCQVEYYDDRRCPPLVVARKGRSRARAKGRPEVALR
jgi:ferredoxin